jgi:hypothetical protein
LAETITTVTTAGWDLVAVDQVALPAVLTRRQDFARLQHRALSTLEHLDARAVDQGMDRIAAALAVQPDADDPVPVEPQDLLVFTRRARATLGAPGRA